MNKITIILKDNGSIAKLEKNFKIYQGSSQNALINILVPKAVVEGKLYTQFLTNGIASYNNENGIHTAVKIGLIYQESNGKRGKTEAFYVRYLKNITKDNVDYLLYERVIPSIFTAVSGVGLSAPELVVNVVNIIIDDNFSEDGVLVREPRIYNVITSQSCRFEVEPSTLLDIEQIVEPSDIETLEAKVNSINSNISKITQNFNNYYDKTETYSKNEIDGSLSAINTALEGKQDVGDYATNTQVDNKISLAISSVTDNAPEAFDTLKEIADWIHNDEQGTSALINRVNVVEGKCTSLQGQVNVDKINIESNASQIEKINSQVSILNQNVDIINSKNNDQDRKLALTVLTSQQNLTEEQKSQVRQNIGASATNLQGSYDDVKKQIISELAVSNNNLLINGDFQVNQRGQEIYVKPASSGTFYTFDRWRVYSQDVYNSSISKMEKGIRIVNEASGMNFFQMVEMDWSSLLDKKVTMSVKINGEVSSLTAQLPSAIPIEQNTNFKTLQKNGYALRIEIRRSNNIMYLCAGIYCGASTLDIEFIKLEFGDKATPFISRCYAEELALCQRYYQVIEGYRVGICSPRTDNQIRGCMQLITRMRAKPTVTQLHTLDMYNLSKLRLETQLEIDVAPVFTTRESTALVALGSYTGLELGDILIPNFADVCFAMDAEIY